MYQEDIVFVGSYGGRRARLLRPEGGTYTDGGPKSLLFLGDIPLGAYSIRDLAKLGIGYFLISVNRQQDRAEWDRIFGDGVIPHVATQYATRLCDFCIHDMGKPTDIFSATETQKFLSRYPNVAILWCFGDDYLPSNHWEILINAYRTTGMSVATRKSASRFDGVLAVSPVFDDDYTIRGWTEGGAIPEWVANPPMVISPSDREAFLFHTRDRDTAGVLMRTYQNGRPLRTVDGNGFVNVNTYKDLLEVCSIIGCQLPP